VRVCTTKQIEKGEMFSFDHNDKKILLTNLDGTIYATDRICTHAEAELSTGMLSSEGIRCPLHLSVFNLQTGQPQNPPAEKPLKTYKVKTDKNEIYVEV
jgi:nitrite reductase/ring-hydroxylating ferredoxin subunit